MRNLRWHLEPRQVVPWERSAVRFACRGPRVGRRSTERPHARATAPPAHRLLHAAGRALLRGGRVSGPAPASVARFLVHRKHRLSVACTSRFRFPGTSGSPFPINASLFPPSAAASRQPEAGTADVSDK